MIRTVRPLATLLVVLAAGTACSSGSSPSPSPLPSPSEAASPSPLPSPSPVTASPSAAPSPTVAALPACRTAQLRLSLGTTQGGAGQFHQPLVLTNTGARCSLYGYPGVSFLDAAGRQLGSPAEAEPGTRKTLVVLAAGGAASAALTYSNAGAYPDSTCRPQEAATVRVYPPGERAALTTPDKVLVCSAPGSHQLRIGPVAAGTSG